MIAVQVLSVVLLPAIISWTRGPIHRQGPHAPHATMKPTITIETMPPEQAPNGSSRPKKIVILVLNIRTKSEFTKELERERERRHP
jgi:hypothetical protein